MRTEIAVEKRGNEHYLVVSIPSDMYGVIFDLPGFHLALDVIVNHTAGAMPMQDIVRTVEQVLWANGITSETPGG